jgi:hypothetical protein
MMATMTSESFEESYEDDLSEGYTAAFTVDEMLL